MDSIKGKKILFVITKSNWGGAQAYVCMLAVRCQKEGAEVVVAFGGTGMPDAPAGLLAHRLQESGVRTIQLSSFARDISLSRERAAFTELRNVIRRERPDIVHLNSSKAGGLGALAARCEHVKKIIFTAHGWAFREPRPFIKRALIWISSWLTAVLSHTIIVVSELDYRTSPVLFSHRKIQIVRNGIESFELLPREEARETLEKFEDGDQLKSFPFWILIQSELHKNKGVDTALEAFVPIAESRNDVALVVIGEGEERAALEKQIQALGLKDHVFFLGFIANSRSYLRAGSLFLLPSRKEGLPLTLLEAGHAGLPVIATRVGGVPEIITPDKNGLLIDPNNPVQLQEAISTYLSDTEKARRMGAVLRETIEKEFSAEKMFRKTIEAYAY